MHGLEVGRRERERESEVQLGGQLVKLDENFKYLGSLVQSHGDTNTDVTQRIVAEWAKRKQFSEVLCNKRVSINGRENITGQ